MAFDDQGRILVGLEQQGIGRITLAKDLQPEAPQLAAPQRYQFAMVERTLSECRGVLFAFDSLYVSATNSKGFYRLRDTTGDDQFDEIRMLKAFDYKWRYGHGTNQVVLGPDKMIYLVNGNDILIPADVAKDSAYLEFRDDLLLPNPRDAGESDRVGHILRTDSEGQNWEVIAGGFRNPFDMVFNADGEMFTYDADMEWDVGLPWYRPTRLNHVVPGGEYGWRWDTRKWPVDWEDSLPTTLDTGLGSPTGMVFGTHSRFPPRYRDALFMADWQNGRILLVDVHPVGASYSATYEVFVEGGPLNVCDLEFGPDGALYFITGGRGSQSGLYRVTHHAPAAVPDELANSNREVDLDQEAQVARAQRRHLESLRTSHEANAVEEIWPFLNSHDRWLRFAARRALERLDLSLWRNKALQESRPTAATQAMLALCRCGAAVEQADVLVALQRIGENKLNQTDWLTLLRGYQLCFLRLGPPNADTMAAVRRRLAGRYPDATASANHLLCELLVYLGDESVVEKTLALLAGNDLTQEEQVRAAETLWHARVGWTPERKRDMLRWLTRVDTFVGAQKLLEWRAHIKQDFVATLSEAEQQEFADEIAALNRPALENELPVVMNRPLVKNWSLADFEARLGEVDAGRSFENGRRALLAASCLQCHRVGDTGGQIGPDLTTVGKRFDSRALLESVLEPSKVMDPKYRHMTYVLNNGRVITGRPLTVDGEVIQVETDALRRTVDKIQRSEIEESFPSRSSPMPAGLLDVLQAEEVLDLLAYLRCGGDPQAAAFE